MNDPYHEIEVRRGGPEEVRTHLLRLSKLLQEVAQQMAQQEEVATGKDVRRVMLVNLAARSSLEAKRLSDWVGGPTDQVAWAARNLFELNLRLQHVMRSSQNVGRFFAESVSDEIDLVKAMQTWCGPNDVELRQRLEERIEAREGKLEDECLEAKKPLSVAQLAREVGAEREYEAFFKLYSKYVHPTGFLLNRRLPRGAEFNERVQGILLLNAQQYAFDTLKRVAEESRGSPA